MSISLFKKGDWIRRKNNGRVVNVVAVSYREYHLHDPKDGEYPACGFEVGSIEYIDKFYELLVQRRTVLKPRRELML